jgi:membrane-associated protease RseP (regulator of RpoE activity)
VDTGDFNGIDVNQSFVKKFALLENVPRYHGVFSKGAGGNDPPEWITRLKTVCIGRACVRRMVAYLSDGQASWDEYAGTIGADILKHFRVTIEWPHHVLYLEKNSKRLKPDIFNRSGILADFDDDGKGLKVAAVLSNSPAEKAGVKVGDRITLIDNQPPANAWGSDEPAFHKRPGTVVSITIVRDHALQELKIRSKNLI